MNQVPTVVLIGDLEVDRAMALAISDLQALSSHGLLHPVWVVDVHDAEFSDEVVADRIADGERESVGLFRSLAEVRNPGTTRIVAVASAALTGSDVTYLDSFTWVLIDRLRWFQPEGVEARSAAVVFPDRIGESSDLTGLLDARHAANLVVAPEDRRADGSFATPISLGEVDVFAAHMAAEIAAQVGLWRSMIEAPIDSGRPGMIDGSEPIVHLVRSYACSALGPALPLFDAVAADRPFPVPQGVEASPAERESANRFADDLFGDLGILHLKEPEPFTPVRAPKGVKAAFVFWMQRIGTYVRHIPGNLRRSLAVDFEASAGRLLTTALGEEAEVEVIWTGKSIGPDLRDPEGFVETIVEGLEARINQVGAPVVDQHQWSRVVRDLVAVMDAGPNAQTTLKADARQMVIAGVDRVAPEPGSVVQESLDGLLGEHAEPSEPTMLSRLVERAVREERRAHSILDELIAGIRRLARLAKMGNHSKRSFLTWGIGVLTAVLVVAVVLATDAHGLIRLDSWSNTTREIVGIAIAVLALGVGFSTLSGVFVKTDIDFSDQSVDEVDAGDENDEEAAPAEASVTPDLAPNDTENRPDVPPPHAPSPPIGSRIVPPRGDLGDRAAAASMAAADDGVVVDEAPDDGGSETSGELVSGEAPTQPGTESAEDGEADDLGSPAAATATEEGHAVDAVRSEAVLADEPEPATEPESRTDVETAVDDSTLASASPTETRKRWWKRREPAANRPPLWRRVLSFLGRPFRVFAIGTGPMAERRRRAVRLASIPLLIGIGVSIWARWQTFSSLIWRQFPPEELGIIGGVIGTLVVALLIMVRQPQEQSGHARRLTGTTLVIYCAIAVVGLVVRKLGWLESQVDSVVRERSIQIAIVSAILILAFFTRLIVIRVQEELQMANAIKRLRWNAAEARKMSEEVVRLRSVLSQLLGTIVAVNRLLWYPFGKRPAEQEFDLADLAHLQALKLHVMTFEPTDRDQMGILARIRRVIGQRGWLHAQYDRAARAFLPELAFLNGQHESEMGDRRPEHDPTLVDTTTSDIKIGMGPRWRFAELLSEGAFDHDLASAGYEALFEDGLDLYLGVPGSEDGVLPRGRQLVSGQPPRIQPEVLARVGITTAGDERAAYETKLWWPRPLQPPEFDDSWTLLRSEVDHHDHAQMVIQFVRTDWSRPIPRAKLPIFTAGSTPVEESAPAPDSEALL